MPDSDQVLKGFLHSYETLGTQDGPGLRLVVFLQGCPLRCQYCHNPDTWSFQTGQEVTVSDIVAKAKRLKPYFLATGGVTISGGDPLAQAEFTLQLLIALRDEGIHTALDTSGSIRLTAVQRRTILKAADVILLDIKHTDPTAFSHLTGVSIEPLLEFLAALAKSRTSVWLRQVIVPGLNDSSKAVDSLITLIRQFPELNIARVELLGYHTLGLSKYQQLSIPYLLNAVPAMPPEKLAAFQAQIDHSFPPEC